MNFEQWWNKTFKRIDTCEPYPLRDKQIWDACKEETLKIIKSKYPKSPRDVNDLIYEDGWDLACMNIEEKIKQL